MVAQRLAYTTVNELALRGMTYVTARGAELPTAGARRFIAAQLGVLLASILSHPFSTLRHCLQVEPGLGVSDVIKLLGWRGLWRGLFPNVTRLLITGLILLGYDNIATRYDVYYQRGNQQMGGEPAATAAVTPGPLNAQLPQ